MSVADVGPFDGWILGGGILGGGQGAAAIATQTSSTSQDGRAGGSSTRAASGRPRAAGVLSDAEALERARGGDHDAFRVLVERYQDRALRLAMRVLRDEERARDAVQDAFLKVYSALDRFEGRSGFYTWLYRVVFNRCLDLQRRDRARPLAYTVDPAEESGLEETLVGAGSDEAVAASRFASPEEDHERGELRALLAAAVEKLPEEARQTFLLREVDGLSYAEIAEVLDIPKGTVMSRLHNARRRLREALLEAGVPDPALAGTSGGTSDEEVGA